MKNNEKLETNGLCKETINGIYLHPWSFAPVLRKKGMLKTLIGGAYTVFLNANFLL